MNKSAIIIAALVAGISATAQNFQKEITIERQFNPTLRAATRLGATPALQQPKFNVEPLRFSDVVIAAETGASIDTLAAASPMAAITPSPWRGYAAVGYFPAYNLGASAGYRIIDKSATSLGLWTQFNGSSYNGDFFGDPDEELKFRRNTVTVGSDFTAIINRAGRLDISADFTYDNLRDPWSADPDPSRHSVTLLNVDAHWSARSTTMAYYVSADYHNFSFHRSQDPVTGVSGNKPFTPTQHDYNLQGGTAYFFTDRMQLAGSIGMDFLSTSDYILPSVGSSLAGVRSKTLGLINFDPSFRYSNDLMRLNIGLRIQFMSHMQKSINVAPDISFTYTPSSALSVFATLNGSKRLNTLAGLWEWCPYINSSLAYEASNIPLDANIGLTVGPFSGFSATLSGGYAMANDWLMPDFDYENNPLDIPLMPVALTPVNLRAFHGQLTLAYSHSPLLRAEASCSLAPGSRTSAWYVNRDRAKMVLNVKAESSPIDRLTVNASFTLRHGRSAWPGMEEVSLGDSNSLDLGADYALTSALNIFARVENILNNRAMITWGLPSQGIRGSIGAALKF